MNTFKTEISANALRASVFTAATKDVRFYLCGVLLEHKTPGRMNVVSTDGHRMGVYQVGIDEAAPAFEIIVPIHVVKAAVKAAGAKAREIALTKLGGEQWALGGQIFTPIDGVFPDWRRVVPNSASTLSRDATQWPAGTAWTNQFDPEYLLDAYRAILAFNGAKKDAFGYAYCYQLVSGRCVVQGEDKRGLVVVMGLIGLDKRHPDNFTAPDF